jgi:hypothetical protein
MSKIKKTLLSILLLTVVLIALPPLLAPVVHGESSPKSALRADIYKNGHPYQSFLARITENDYVDPEYGQLYHVQWVDFNSPTGETAAACYAIKQDDSYTAQCGTGP